MAAFTVIDHQELTGTTAYWDYGAITPIPTDGTYDHLMLKVSARQDGAYDYVNVYITLNGDTGNNYSHTTIRTDSTTVESNRNTSRANIHYCMTPAASATANTFGAMTIWIPHYANTANFKQMIASSAVENDSTTNSEWWLNQTAGLWSSQSAVDQITVDAYSTDDFVQYSTFTLYGIKGA
jgi:hypothetical protein